MIYKYREQVMGMERLASDYLTSNRKIQGRKWGNITTLHRDYLHFNCQFIQGFALNPKRLPRRLGDPHAHRMSLTSTGDVIPRRPRSLELPMWELLHLFLISVLLGWGFVLIVLLMLVLVLVLVLVGVLGRRRSGIVRSRGAGWCRPGIVGRCLSRCICVVLIRLCSILVCAARIMSVRSMRPVLRYRESAPSYFHSRRVLDKNTLSHNLK